MNLEEIKELIRVFGRSKLGKLKVKDAEFEIAMQKEGSEVVVAQAPVQAAPVESAQAPVTAASAPAESAAEPASVSGDAITSPMVGTFYAAPSPDSPAFASVGDVVKKGQVLCILEAMKIMNELEAEYDCKIVEILVQDGEPVEYDMPLFRVEKL
jgi:acetyl-CoA carboxylase biotin carboxyl carrier protein